MDKDVAISVKNVSKAFRIPHEKVSSLRGAAVRVFKRSSYEEFKALDDVSFDVKKGEFFGIIGRNGSGKSTLLKILAGIYQTDKGSVDIDGRISPFLELGIGFNPELSGRDNVYLNATVLGLTKKEIDKKFDSIVKFSELERFIDQKLKNYSSGMQVRLAFSVSIHANREILLMDEVLAVGDSNFQNKCLEEFNKYRDMGKTVILVTHDINTVQRYCDRAMLIRNGKIMRVGNAEEIGNEYLRQNMFDEDERMSMENSYISEINIHDIDQKLSNQEKIAKIVKVEFLDEKGVKKNVFETGDVLLARVYFEVKSKTDKLFNFGLGLYDQENNYYTGINTFYDNIETKKYLESGYFEVKFSKIPLKMNSYYILAGIWGELPSMQYDLLERSNTFKIMTSDKNHGIVAMNYTWN